MRRLAPALVMIGLLALLGGAGQPRLDPLPGPLPGFRDGPVPTLPPTPIAPPARKPTDRRPFYVIGGLLVLGSIYLWNRSRRAALPPAPPGRPSENTSPDDPER